MLERFWQWLGWERRAVSYADPALAYLYGDLRSNSAGEAVSLERAVGLTAVWACVNLIAGAIASMPLILYRRTEEDGRQRAESHVLFDVLKIRPNALQSVHTFWESMVVALLLRGNSYATLVRDDNGSIRAMFYVSPDCVAPELLKNGRLRYRINTGSATQIVDANNMLHIVGPMASDGLVGTSVITAFRQTLGLNLAEEVYAGEFFSNAATPKGVLTTPGRLSEPAQSRLKAALEEQHASRGRRHKTMILEEGLTFAPIGISFQDSQFVEARAFGVQEVARMFNVPVSMINGDQKMSLTYSNAETRALDFLKFTLLPWTSRIQSACNFSLISPAERHTLYCEFLPDALLATSTMERYQAYQLGLTGGWLQLSEVRAKENLPALPERSPAIP